MPGNHRLLLVNIYTHQNMGEAARHFGICEGLLAAMPQVKLTLVVPDALTGTGFKERLGDSITIIRQAIPSSSAFFYLHPLRLPALLRAYREADMVISIGGHFGQLSSLPPMLLAVLMHKRLVICSASTYDGLKQSRLHRALARRILDAARLVTLREAISLDHLKRWGVARPQMQVTADPAFLLADNRPGGDRVLAQAGLEGRRPLVGINVSRYPAIDDLCYTGYTAAMVKLINYLTGELKLDVLLLPFCFVPGNDDRADNRRILKLVQQPEKVTSIEEPLDPAVMRGLLSRLDMFIGTRYHANLLSLAEGVPTLAISYHHKMEGAMAALGLQAWLCPNSALDATLLVSKAGQLWRERADVRRKLSSQALEMEKQARCGVGLIKDALAMTASDGEVKLEERLSSDAS